MVFWVKSLANPSKFGRLARFSTSIQDLSVSHFDAGFGMDFSVEVAPARRKR